MNSRTAIKKAITIALLAFVAIPAFELQSAAGQTVEPYSVCPSVDEEIVDLNMLVGALRETKSVGLLTKLHLKKDIEKILGRFEAWHSGTGKYSLEQLEEQYNLLLMKIASIVHDRDVGLHQQLCNAWAVIWLDLQDPDRFGELHGSAGV